MLVALLPPAEAPFAWLPADFVPPDLAEADFGLVGLGLVGCAFGLLTILKNPMFQRNIRLATCVLSNDSRAPTPAARR